LSLRNAVQAHTKDSNMLNTRVKYWLKPGELNLIKLTYKTAIPYKSYAFEHLLQCLELNQTRLFECSPLKFEL